MHQIKLFPPQRALLFMILSTTAITTFATPGNGQEKQTPDVRSGQANKVYELKPVILRHLNDDTKKSKLNLTAEQLRSINELRIPPDAELFETYGVYMKKWLKSTDEERVALVGVLDNSYDAMSKEADKRAENELVKILDEKQFQLLKQLIWQENGAMALFDDEVANALTLSSEQKAEMTEILYRFRRGIIINMKRDPHFNIEEERKEMNRKILDTLTDEQMARWKELIGVK